MKVDQHDLHAEYIYSRWGRPTAIASNGDGAFVAVDFSTLPEPTPPIQINILAQALREAYNEGFDSGKKSISREGNIK